MKAHFGLPPESGRFPIIDNRMLKVKSGFIEVNGMEPTVNSPVLVRK
jgi:hypothetical protein